MTKEVKNKHNPIFHLDLGDDRCPNCGSIGCVQALTMLNDWRDDRKLCVDAAEYHEVLDSVDEHRPSWLGTCPAPRIEVFTRILREVAGPRPVVERPSTIMIFQ